MRTEGGPPPARARICGGFTTGQGPTRVVTPHASQPFTSRPHPPKRHTLSGDGEEVDATSEFATVVRYKLGRHRIVMAAEIDAEAPQQPEAAASAAAAGGEGAGAEAKEGKQPPPQYVEMKCYKIPGHRRAEATMYGQKHPRW